ncbi:type II toxin-antitoxin system ParD family antitoxin [Asticcacaulis excentricus]|uniref:Addiction module antidote protein, CC2985 family n=1 Tax=Asticcacaulis excentricus (strain ATCC 15261 / DSM 4724 / KCTC 12464 / NCIMB 9791 / VKM B-1370 / CB 48) TaxID=573065 RepID=E8RPJ6_ASTEC|nr:type II toxin-antitoxin system ParD family antitoxin [Asticcacaulis excentricus]ADU13094.1 addiction module antidote protein, CC2985 family [Asticcacaulis excentricus CB 48]
MATSVALNPHFEAFINSQISIGRCNNVSEVIREGLRLQEDCGLEKRRQREAVRAEIAKGRKVILSPRALSGLRGYCGLL